MHESLEDAEAHVARAEAAAEAARARAERLRRDAREARGEAAGGDPAVSRRRWLRRPGWLRRPRWLRLPGWRALTVGAAVVLACALATASGYIVVNHRAAMREQRQRAEFVAAARQGATNLMSIDFTHARQDVQRVIDDSTGLLNRQYQDNAQQLIKGIQDSKVVTKVTVNAVAVESMSRDTAVVLVAATTARHSAQDATDQPAKWKMTITLDRDGGQLKMSNVEFMR